MFNMRVQDIYSRTRLECMSLQAPTGQGRHGLQVNTLILTETSIVLRELYADVERFDESEDGNDIGFAQSDNFGDIKRQSLGIAPSLAR